MNLDAEFDRADTAIDSLVAFLAVSLNADGSLKSNAVSTAYTGAASNNAGGTDLADAHSALSALLAQAWAEYLLDAIPAATLIQMGITGQHYSAILWRHDNGAKWRAVPDELRPWWIAAQTSMR